MQVQMQQHRSVGEAHVIRVVVGTAGASRMNSHPSRKTMRLGNPSGTKTESVVSPGTVIPESKRLLMRTVIPSQSCMVSNVCPFITVCPSQPSTMMLRELTGPESSSPKVTMMIPRKRMPHMSSYLPMILSKPSASDSPRQTCWKISSWIFMTNDWETPIPVLSSLNLCI